MNNNQYTSLPHSSSGGGVNVGARSNPQGPRPNHKKKNYNKKKNFNNQNNNNQNNNNNNQNNGNGNVKQQPFNNYTNNQDFGHSSLPHTQYSPNRYNNQYSPKQFNQFKKFNDDAPETLKNFGNNVPVPALTRPSNPQNNKKHNNRHKRGGGSNNNYRGTGSFNNENDRLNKSFNKDETSLNNSFSEITNKMSTSFSLDSFDLKGSVSMANSHSFTSPSKALRLSEVETIIEQEVIESSSANSNLDSGVDSNSYCSMPASDVKSYTPLTSELLSSIEVEETEESSRPDSSSSSSSAPDSPNQNGYETAISQMASEAEVSFGGYDSIVAEKNAAENTINNLNIEASFANQIEAAVLENYLQKNLSEEIKIVDIQTVEDFVSADNDTTTSCPSDSSENGSFKEMVEQFSVNNAEKTVLVSEQETVEDSTVAQSEPVIEKAEVIAIVVPDSVAEEAVVAVEETIAQMEPQAEEIITTVVPEQVLETIVEPETEQTEAIAPESVAETTREAAPVVNLISEAEKTMERLDTETEEALSQLKYAEQEVNDLVNKIVLDVITNAIYAAPLAKETEAPFAEVEAPNYMSLEQEISQLEEAEKANSSEAKCIDDREISFIDNDNSVVDIEASEEPKVDATDAILSSTEKVLRASPLKVLAKDNSTVTKEPPVDCFSCTIS